MLLENFDDTDYKKVEKDVEKVVNETRDLPICKEEESTNNSTIITSESIDDPTSTMLVDDNGDKFIIQSKLIINFRFTYCFIFRRSNNTCCRR